MRLQTYVILPMYTCSLEYISSSTHGPSITIHPIHMHSQTHSLLHIHAPSNTFLPPHTCTLKHIPSSTYMHPQTHFILHTCTLKHTLYSSYNAHSNTLFLSHIRSLSVSFLYSHSTQPFPQQNRYSVSSQCYNVFRGESNHLRTYFYPFLLFFLKSKSIP